jgi:hypothetical protein
MRKIRLYDGTLIDNSTNSILHTPSGKVIDDNIFIKVLQIESITIRIHNMYEDIKDAKNIFKSI